MTSYQFNETVTIGDLEFEASGTYYPEENLIGFYDEADDDSVPLEFEFESITVTINAPDGTFTLDATPILDSLECWDKLEEELENQIEFSTSDEFDSLDSVDKYDDEDDSY